MHTRILLADDHQLFRQGLRSMLPAEEFQVVAEAADGQEAIQLVRRHEPDVAVLDVSMPGLNGVDGTREVLRTSPRTRVVVLTMHRETPYVVGALAAGARGYVLKSQPVSDVVQALREVGSGGVYVPPEYVKVLVDMHHDGADRVVQPLSARERQVLQLVAEGKTTKEIAYTLGISFKTAESHRTRIMAKLGIHETAGLVRYAIRNRLIEA
ncbi:MAG TPA: response regulator transcription factor [Candidatus Eisenbacteria bacterium]|jgi:DNA-binding NarL/FixJ family response regulator